MNKILKSKRLLSIVLALLCAATVFAATDVVAEENSDERVSGARIVITDDFGTSGKIADYDGVFEYNNLCKDVNGNKDWGLVTGASWGAATTAGKGYITFKVEADDGYTLNGMSVKFNAYHGHKSLTEYFGRSKTNLVVYTSADNTKWKRVYDLALIKYSMWGNGNLYNDCRIDCSEVFDGETVAYVKFELVHVDYSGLTEAHQQLPNVARDGKILLQFLGVRLHGVNISANQKEIGAKPARIVTEEKKASGKVKILKEQPTQE